LVATTDARKSFIRAHKTHFNVQNYYGVNFKHYDAQDYVSIAGEGMNSISQVLSGTAEFLSELSGAAKILKGLGPLLAAIGPAMAIVNIFLGDPMDKKLDEINNKVDEVLSTLNRKFDDLENFIEKLQCKSEIANSLVFVKTATDELKLQMNNAKEQKKGLGSAAVKKFFLEKIKTSKSFDGLSNNMNKIIDLLTSTGQAAQSCNIIESVAKGSQESDGLAGSTTALLQVFLPIFNQLDEGLACVLAMDEAFAIEGENVEITKEKHRYYWTEKKIKAGNSLKNFAEKLDSPVIFASNTKKNLQKIWISIKGQGFDKNQSGDWKGYDISPIVYQKLSKVFPDKTFAIFTYRDLKEDNYFKSIRKYDASYRTKDDTPTFERNYVIEVAFNQKLGPIKDKNEYLKDVGCLEIAYGTIFAFRQRSDSAENFITDQLFKEIDSKCNNRLGGVTVVWEPPRGSSVLFTSHYAPSNSYRGLYQECKWRKQNWCEMNGRMYHVFDMPQDQGWRWRAYIWTA
jgi:hypothetical protein